MHNFTPVYTPFAGGMLGLIFPFIVLLVVVTVILKGYALWHSARAGQKYWFLAILIINSVGILEIIYLLFFRPGAPYKHVVDNAKKSAAPIESSPTA